MKKFGPNFESENVAVLSHLIKFSLIDNEQPIYEQKVFKQLKWGCFFLVTANRHWPFWYATFYSETHEYLYLLSVYVNQTALIKGFTATLNA